MQASNYPPDYNDIKHVIDDPVEEIEELPEFDESDDIEQIDPFWKPIETDAAIIEESPLFDIDK